MRVIELPERGGKARPERRAGAGATRLLVFTDASIELEPDALQALVGPFADRAESAVSGEDVIAESGGEALYGRYELMLRRLESAARLRSSAPVARSMRSGGICQPFTEGMAPDFLSVLRTVEQGYRAVSEPKAVGA